MNELSYNDPILSYIMDFDKFYCQIWRKDSEKDFTDSFTLPEIITSPLPSYLRTYIYDAVNSENAVPSESTLQTANFENSKEDLWKKDEVYLVQYAAMQALGLLIRSNPGKILINI